MRVAFREMYRSGTCIHPDRCFLPELTGACLSPATQAYFFSSFLFGDDSSDLFGNTILLVRVGRTGLMCFGRH